MVGLSARCYKVLNNRTRFMRHLWFHVPQLRSTGGFSNLYLTFDYLSKRVAYCAGFWFVGWTWPYIALAYHFSASARAIWGTLGYMHHIGFRSYMVRYFSCRNTHLHLWICWEINGALDWTKSGIWLHQAWCIECGDRNCTRCTPSPPALPANEANLQLGLELANAECL